MITKEKIIEEYAKNGLKIDKIVKSKLGGYYVYHPYGNDNKYYDYKTLKIENGKKTIIKERRHNKVDFIDCEDLLALAISEAKARKGKNNEK